jgi:hypothetical protein
MKQIFLSEKYTLSVKSAFPQCWSISPEKVPHPRVVILRYAQQGEKSANSPSNNEENYTYAGVETS